ncbi:MAG: GNAT family N-acetyltransferase [Clostridia bacterium]|nr:GNAT family N-acetyltransferase [Clostridia bacterium]
MAVYFESQGIRIRSMLESDALALSKAFAEQGWQKPVEQFERYFREQAEHKRFVIVAEVDDKAAGYVTLFPEAQSGPYAFKGIPEIVDFNVLIKYQRRGVGKHLMDIVERMAGQMARSVSLSVGLHSGYGTAQRMYAKRGYIPDGSGLWYRSQPVQPYVSCINNDDLVLYMEKALP